MTADRQEITLNPGGDQRQGLRLRRYLMAAGTSMMVIVLLYVAYLLGGLERAGLVQGAALILFWVALFYGLLRSGLNLKFRDASMTMPQLLSSIVTMAFVMYYADRGRAALLIVFLVSFLFGVFRLRTWQLMILAATAIASYGMMVGALLRYKPETVEAADEILQFVVLLFTLPWFAFMGGHVSKLRDDVERTAKRIAKLEQKLAQATGASAPARQAGQQDLDL